MRRLSLLTAVAILAVATTSFAAPAKPTAKPTEVWAAGQITRVDATAKSVVIMQGEHELTFSLAANAHLMQGKKVLQLSDLTGDIGRQAKVRYTASGTNKVADRIEVMAAAAPGAAKPPAKR